ncbi:MAG: hypothetical protein ABI581_04060 [Sediminibacterium sp.]
MSTWNLIVIVAGVVLLIFVCRKEFVRANKARLWWRILASLLSVVCLICMGLPITFNSTAISGSSAIIITDGTDEDSLQQFRKDQKQKIVLYHVDDLFSTEHPVYDSLHVFGYGLSDDELKMLNGAKLIFHPAKISSGVTAVDWNRKVEKGKELLIQGTYKNQTASPVTLLLNGFNTILDSFTVNAREERSFRLHTVPKQNGKAIYSLSAHQQKDTLENDPIPIEVFTPVPIKVLMLSASPDFENRFLKDWLSQNGYTVLSKTTISTNKFDKTILNAGSLSLDHVTTGLLDSVDVVISDETSLLTLSKPEQENIYSQVSRKGMGMIIRADTMHLSKAWFAGSFQLYTGQGKQPSHVSIHTINDEISNAVLAADQPLFIHFRNGMQPLALDSAKNIMSGVIAEGAGKIALTTLTNTYSWMLAGNTANYYSFWSGLLQKTARKKVSGIWIESTTSLPVEQQSVPFQLITNGNSFPFVEIDGKRIALAQNENLGEQWHSSYWPVKPGWQSVSIGGMNNNWYVFDKHDWKYVTAQKKISATGYYTQNINNGLKNEGIANKALPVPVPMVYFFLPFIICCGFLWMERKIF